MDFDKAELINNWDKWKHTLAKAVTLGEGIGLSEKTVNGIAYRIGNMLSASVDPENREQRLLQELWRAGDDEDRRVMAKLIVKIVETDDKYKM